MTWNSNTHKHRKFHLNMRKNFFIVSVTEHYNKLSRVAVGYPSLRYSKPAKALSCVTICSALAWVWTGSPEVSSNTCSCLILWFCEIDMNLHWIFSLIFSASLSKQQLCNVNHCAPSCSSCFLFITCLQSLETEE